METSQSTRLALLQELSASDEYWL